MLSLFIANVFLEMKKSHSNLSKTNIEKSEEHSRNKKYSEGTKKVVIGNNGGRKQWLSKTMCEPNFSCAFCNATFVRIDSMQSHLRQHQKLQPELEGEIFSLQQQLQQQQQSNQHQPTVHYLSKKSNDKTICKNDLYSSHGINIKNVKLKSYSNDSFSQNDTSNRKNVIANIIEQPLQDKVHVLHKTKTRKLDDSPSSIIIPSDSISSSPTSPDLVISQDNIQSPITLVVSPEKAGKPLSTSSNNELQQISPSNLQGISYLTVSPTNETVDRNVTTLSVPVASTPQIPSTKSALHSTSPLNSITLIQQPNGQVYLYLIYHKIILKQLLSFLV